MQVNITTSDEDNRSVYETPGYAVKVVTQPEGEGETVVEVWDEAGCQDRQLRPADQAHRVALKTLFNEYKADQAQRVVVSE